MNRIFVEQSCAVHIKTQKEWKAFCSIVLREYKICDLNSNYRYWRAYGISHEDRHNQNMIQGIGNLGAHNVISFDEFMQRLQNLDVDSDQISGLEEIL